MNMKPPSSSFFLGLDLKAVDKSRVHTGSVVCCYFREKCHVENLGILHLFHALSSTFFVFFVLVPRQKGFIIKRMPLTLKVSTC